MKERSANKKTQSDFKSKSKSKDKNILNTNLELEHKKTFTTVIGK